jgi:TRAP-type C4-dicarboxylate transport system permease small subunit
MKPLVERLEKAQTWLSFAMVMLIMICVCIHVFVHYVLQEPLFVWSGDRARFLPIWTVFLGIGVGMKNVPTSSLTCSRPCWESDGVLSCGRSTT